MSSDNLRYRFTESILPHIALLLYTALALFPIFLIVINSFKTRKAIFREPLAFPTSETFSLEGYITVWERAGFPLYFRNSLIVTVVQSSLYSLWRDGCLRALGIQVSRQHLHGPLLGFGHHDPHSFGHSGHFAAGVVAGSCE